MNTIKTLSQSDPASTVRKQLLDLGCALADYAATSSATNAKALASQYTKFLTYLDSTRDPRMLSYAFKTMADFGRSTNTSQADRKCAAQVLRDQQTIIQAINDAILESVATCRV